MESIHLILSVMLMGLLPLPPAVSQTSFRADQLSLAAPAPAGAEMLQTKSFARLSASGVSILDLQSGQEIYARQSNRRRPMGSLTKLMTALLIAERHGMDEEVTIPADLHSVDSRLPPKAHFTVGDLLSAMLIVSANDAADALARFDSRSEDAFVKLMNERAASLGLNNTSFANPSGLDDSLQWSTPRDIAWLTAFVLRHPELRKRMSTIQTVIQSSEGQTLHLEHTHALMRQHTVLAGKTGTTAAAHECLVSLVEERGHEYVIVLLGSGQRYLDMRAVLRALSAVFA